MNSMAPLLYNHTFLHNELYSSIALSSHISTYHVMNSGSTALQSHNNLYIMNSTVILLYNHELYDSTALQSQNHLYIMHSMVLLMHNHTITGTR